MSKYNKKRNDMSSTIHPDDKKVATVLTQILGSPGASYWGILGDKSSCPLGLFELYDKNKSYAPMSDEEHRLIQQIFCTSSFHYHASNIDNRFKAWHALAEYFHRQGRHNSAVVCDAIAVKQSKTEQFNAQIFASLNNVKAWVKFHVDSHSGVDTADLMREVNKVLKSKNNLMIS